MPGKIWNADPPKGYWTPPPRPWWKTGFYGFVGTMLISGSLGLFLAFLKSILSRYGWGQAIDVVTTIIFAIGGCQYFVWLRKREDAQYFSEFYWSTIPGLVAGYIFGLIVGLLLWCIPVP